MKVTATLKSPGDLWEMKGLRMENKAKRKLSGRPGGRRTLSSHPESHPLGPVSFRGMSMKCLCSRIQLPVICSGLLQRHDRGRLGKQELLEYIFC